MSVERISGEYGISNQYKKVSLGENETDIKIFDYNKPEERDIADNDILNQQVNKGEGTEGEDLFKQGNQNTQELTYYLESLVSGYEEQFASVKENNGWIARGWDWFKNKTGIGAGSDKVQKQIDDLKKQIEELKKDPSKIKDVYKSVVGNELNEEELNKLINGQVDLSKSEILDSVMKYTQGQKQCTNIISGITSSLAVVGLIAAGVVAAPFTGGMSLAATAGAIGTLTAAGTAAYMVPQVIDGVTEKDGYSFKESMQDIANGVINSAFTAVGMGGGKAVGRALGKAATTQAGKKAAGLAASEATSLIIGDGIGIGNYLTEAAFNDEVDFSWTDLGKTAAVSTTSSLTAGAAAFGASSLVRPILTSGTTASSQIAGRLLSAGITGGSAGMSASAVGGGTNYLLTCAIDGREVSFEEWLNASTENMDSAMLTGFIGGMAFEAVHLAAGTPKPEGAVKRVKGTNEYGLKFTNYLDKDGNVIATDISASEMAKIYGSQVKNEQGLVEYDSTAASSSAGKVYDTARTFRISYTNIPEVEVIAAQDGSEIFTQTQGENYRADLTIQDWADNTYYLQSGVVKGSNIPNTQQNVAEADYEVIYDEVQTPELTGNGINTPQLTQGAPINQESGLVPLQGDNPNSQNIDMVVDTTLLAQLTAQQIQMANVQAQADGVQAQAQGAVISANAVNTGMASNMAGGNNVPPAQVNPPQNGVSSNTPVQTQVRGQSGGEDTSPVLTQETTELQLPTPEEIEQRKAFLEERGGIRPQRVELIANMDNKHYQRALELLDKKVSAYCVPNIVNLEDYQYQRALELIDRDIDPLYIASLASLEDGQYQKALELLDIGISEYHAHIIAQFDENRYQSAIMLKNFGYDDSDLIELTLSEKLLQRTLGLLDKGISVRDISNISELDDIQYQRAMELLDNGVDAYWVSKIAKLGDIQYQRALELMNKGIDCSNVESIAVLEDNQYQKAIDLLDKGVDVRNISNIAKLDDTQYQRAQELIDKGIDGYLATEIAKLDDEQYQTAIKFADAGLTDIICIKNLTFLPKQYQSTAIELVKAGMTDYYDIEDICLLPKQQQSTAIELVKAGMTDSYDIKNICSLPTEQYSTAIELVKTGMKSSTTIARICSLPQEQHEMAIELVKAGVNIYYEIQAICNLPQKHYEIAIQLVKAGITDSYDINKICSFLEEKHIENISEIFMFNDDYGTKIQKAAQGRYQEELTNVFKSTNVRVAFLKSGLSEQDIMQGIRKLAKSTFKFAMNTPNQYLSNIDIKFTTKVDGKYPQLSEEELARQQSQIVQFFKDNIVLMVRALKYIDVDTLNQMMDRRTDLFEETLNKLNNLTDENYELLAKLMQCKSTDRDGRVLTAREKIQLSQIVEIFQDGKLDTDELLKMAETGSVSLLQLKKQIQTEVLKKAGLNETDIESLSESKLKFNEEYSYLTLLNSQEFGLSASQMREIVVDLVDRCREKSETEVDELIGILQSELKSIPVIDDAHTTQLYELFNKFTNMLKNISDYTDEELIDVGFEIFNMELESSTNQAELYTVIRESTLGDFKSFITDETNKYGKTNAKTKEAFISKGLDYEQWLSPDVKDVKIGFRGREFTIKLWDRNPQEDLFMGNKTSCCTAIGTGFNGGATPIYLLNTSYNVVELYDDNGEVIGMSRVFMGEIDEKPALIMDNIELNSKYKDTKATDEEKMAFRDGFFKYMKQYAQAVTGDSKTPVYFYSGDIHVPTYDLDHKYAVTGFVGNISQTTVYVNSAGCSWINPQDFPDRGEIDWLVVP